MKITIVCDVLGEENNGTTITAKRLINELKHRRHDVRVIAPNPAIEDGYFEVPAMNFGIFNKYIAKNGVRIARANKKILTKALTGVDIVHIMLPFSLGRAAIKMCLKNKIPVTAGMHSQAENISSHFFLKNLKSFNDFIYWAMHQTLYKHVDAIHCPSHFISLVLKKHRYLAPRFVASNGVIPLFKPIKVIKPFIHQDQIVILFIGRLSREKRHDLLIKAVKRSRYQQKIQLIFAGAGPLYKKVVAQGRHLSNPPIIDFFAKEKLLEIINYADLYVHPSDAEIEAIACLEAISCGLVPVISDSPQSATNSFALTKHNLFNHKNVNDLTEKINFWIENPTYKDKVSQVYINYAQRFSIEKSINKMEDMFNYVIDQYQR